LLYPESTMISGFFLKEKATLHATKQSTRIGELL